jgi:hypothetical protein
VSERVDFGVGCFTFEWREANEEKSGIDWANDVTEALSSLAHVSNIEVKADQFLLHRTGPEENFDQQAQAHPHPHVVLINFDITIPQRQHDQYLMSGLKASENYRIIIRYGYESPVAYVFPLDRTGNHGDGSTGVELVRKHLAEHFKDMSKVRFSCVGPSPFYAEFSLVSGGLLDEVFECDVLTTRGYDDITFRYDEASFENMQEAQAALMDEINHELSLYYYLYRMKNGRRALAIEVAQQAQALVSLHTEKGIRGRWRRLFTSGGQARSLALAVLDAELDAAWDAQLTESSLQSSYKGGDGFLRSYVEPVAIDPLSPLIVNARNVVHQLESGRTKELEVTLITSATVGGALAGGLISAIVTVLAPA